MRRIKNTKLPSKWGTLPLFVIMLVMIGLLISGLYLLALKTAAFFSEGMWTYIWAIPLAAMNWILFWNIRIPRKLNDPASDLKHQKFLSTGAWTKVYESDDKETVIKQLHFCGWGHNDYSDHMAPVIGSKMCGKWNPLALWFLHYYMMFYQIIGLKRRQALAGRVDAIPDTLTLSVWKLRYTQKFIPYALTPETCPRDINEQFEKLQSQLKACGLYIDDVHAANVRVDSEGKIHLIDGELYTDGEEWIKSKLVRLFNGPTVKGMEGVLGNSRVVRWVDHRKSVDEIVKQAEKKWVLADYRAVRA